MKFNSRPAAAIMSLSLAAAVLTGCTSEQAGGDDTAAAGSSSCESKDVRLVGQVRNESNPYEAAWLDGGDAFAEGVDLKQQRLTYDGDSTKQQEQISQILAGDTKCLVMNVLPNGDSDTAPIGRAPPVRDHQPPDPADGGRTGGHPARPGRRRLPGRLHRHVVVAGRLRRQRHHQQPG